MMASEREYPKCPLVGAGALVVRRGRILLVKRKNPPNRGRWTVPGGLVELGESVEEAAARELKEELGVRAKVGSLFDVITYVELDRSGRIRYHFVLVDYIVRPLGGRLRLNPESSAYGWFTEAQVEMLDMAEDTREVVLRCLKSRPRERLATSSSSAQLRSAASG
jgi:ADP-ribose pyrophosphatase YjhB (NUDIX family)